MDRMMHTRQYVCCVWVRVRVSNKIRYISLASLVQVHYYSVITTTWPRGISALSI